VPVVSLADDQYTLLDIDGPQIYLHWTPRDTEVEHRKGGVELYFRLSAADRTRFILRATRAI